MTRVLRPFGDTAGLSSRLDTQVLVVGAGPTGLLLAAELQRRGVGCRVIDALDAPLHWDRATIVHPRSLEVFESLGIVERFLAAGVNSAGARLHSDGERARGDRPLDLRQPLRVQHRHLGGGDRVDPDDYLSGRAARSMRAARLVELEQREDRVAATIERDGERSESRAAGSSAATAAQPHPRAERHRARGPRHRRALGGLRRRPLAGWAAIRTTIAYLDETPVILTPLPGRRWRVYLRPTSPDSDLVADAAA